MDDQTADDAVLPKRLTRTAQMESKRLRVFLGDFLDSVPFCAAERTSEIECKAVPKGPPLHFQLIPANESSSFDLAEEFGNAFQSPSPDVFKSDTNEVEAARWIAEEHVTEKMNLRISKTASGYRFDLRLWIRQALRLTEEKPTVTLFAVGNVLELYSVSAWYERISAIQRRLGNEEDRGELLADLRARRRRRG